MVKVMSSVFFLTNKQDKIISSAYVKKLYRLFCVHSFLRLSILKQIKLYNKQIYQLPAMFTVQFQSNTERTVKLVNTRVHLYSRTVLPDTVWGTYKLSPIKHFD